MVSPHEFIEITREILQSIGFKNSFCQKKDKTGKAVMKDMRSDFYSALRCLKNTKEFKEGSSFEDVDAHFIVMKTEPMQHQNGGQNKQVLWVRKDAFDKWTHYYKISGATSKRIYNGLVYFIHMEDNFKMFKIGYTTDLKKRLEQLQGGNPHLLCTYKTIENASKKVEKRLDHIFQLKHIRGEWFTITPDMIDAVA